jgi:hypothetical protein
MLGQNTYLRDINKPNPKTGLEVSVFVPVPLGSAKVSRGYASSGGDYYYYFMVVIRNYKCGGLIPKFSRDEVPPPPPRGLRELRS